MHTIEQNLERIADSLEKIAAAAAGSARGEPVSLSEAAASAPLAEPAKRPVGRPAGSTNKPKPTAPAAAPEQPVADEAPSEQDVKDAINALISAGLKARAIALLKEAGAASASGVPATKRAAFIATAKAEAEEAALAN